MKYIVIRAVPIVISYLIIGMTDLTKNNNACYGLFDHALISIASLFLSEMTFGSGGNLNGLRVGQSGMISARLPRRDPLPGGKVSKIAFSRILVCARLPRLDPHPSVSFCKLSKILECAFWGSTMLTRLFSWMRLNRKKLIL